jgi:hypothetical protein
MWYAGQLRGSQKGRDDAKSSEALAAIRSARDMLGEGKLLAGVSGKAINSGRASHLLRLSPGLQGSHAPTSLWAQDCLRNS